MTNPIDDTPDTPVVDINSIPPIPNDDLSDDDRAGVPAPTLTPQELAESEANKDNDNVGVQPSND